MQVGSQLSVEEAPRSPGTRPLWILLGLAVSAVFAWLALRSVSFDGVRDSISEVRLAYLAPVVVLVALPAWLRALRWRLLFADPSSLTTTQSFWAVNLGLMLNTVLPSRAGEIGRIFALRRVTGHSAFEIGMTVVVERMLDVLTMALLGLLIAPWLPDRGWVHVLVALCAAIIVGFALLLVALARLRGRLPIFVARLLVRIPRVSEERAATLATALRAGTRVLLRPRRLLLALIIGAAAWGMAGLSCWLLIRAFGFDVSSAAAWLVLVANTFAVTIPSSSGSLGVYEASVQAALVAYGVTASAALSYALVLHAVNIVPVVILGVIALWALRRDEAEARLLRERRAVSRER